MTNRNPLSNPLLTPSPVPTATAMPSMAEMIAEMEKLKAENDALKKKKEKPLRCQVSQKGAVSIYGLYRFPVTLYGEQWERLFKYIPVVKAFIEEHRSELATKDNPRIVEK